MTGPKTSSMRPIGCRSSRQITLLEQTRAREACYIQRGRQKPSVKLIISTHHLIYQINRYITNTEIHKIVLQKVTQSLSPFAECPGVLWTLQHDHSVNHREHRTRELEHLALGDIKVQRPGKV